MKRFKSESIHEALVEEMSFDNKLQYFLMAFIALIGIICTSMALRDIGREGESFNNWRRANERRMPRRDEKDSLLNNHILVLN